MEDHQEKAAFLSEDLRTRIHIDNYPSYKKSVEIYNSTIATFMRNNAQNARAKPSIVQRHTDRPYSASNYSTNTQRDKHKKQQAPSVNDCTPQNSSYSVTVEHYNEVFQPLNTKETLPPDKPSILDTPWYCLHQCLDSNFPIHPDAAEIIESGQQNIDNDEEQNVKNELNKTKSEAQIPGDINFLCTELKQNVDINKYPLYKLSIKWYFDSLNKKQVDIDNDFVTKALWTETKSKFDNEDQTNNKVIQSENTLQKTVDNTNSDDNEETKDTSNVIGRQEDKYLNISDLKSEYKFLFDPAWIFKRHRHGSSKSISSRKQKEYANQHMNNMNKIEKPSHTDSKCVHGNLKRKLVDPAYERELKPSKQLHLSTQTHRNEYNQNFHLQNQQSTVYRTSTPSINNDVYYTKYRSTPNYTTNRDFYRRNQTYFVDQSASAHNNSPYTPYSYSCTPVSLRDGISPHTPYDDTASPYAYNNDVCIPTTRTPGNLIKSPYVSNQHRQSPLKSNYTRQSPYLQSNYDPKHDSKTANLNVDRKANQNQSALYISECKYGQRTDSNNHIRKGTTSYKQKIPFTSKMQSDIESPFPQRPHDPLLNDCHFNSRQEQVKRPDTYTPEIIDLTSDTKHSTPGHFSMKEVGTPDDSRNALDISIPSRYDSDFSMTSDLKKTPQKCPPCDTEANYSSITRYMQDVHNFHDNSLARVHDVENDTVRNREFIKDSDTPLDRSRERINNIQTGGRHDVVNRNKFKCDESSYRYGHKYYTDVKYRNKNNNVQNDGRTFDEELLRYGQDLRQSRSSNSITRSRYLRRSLSPNDRSGSSNFHLQSTLDGQNFYDDSFSRKTSSTDLYSSASWSRGSLHSSKPACSPPPFWSRNSTERFGSNNNRSRGNDCISNYSKFSRQMYTSRSRSRLSNVDSHMSTRRSRSRLSNGDSNSSTRICRSRLSNVDRDMSTGRSSSRVPNIDHDMSTRRCRSRLSNDVDSHTSTRRSRLRFPKVDRHTSSRISRSRLSNVDSDMSTYRSKSSSNKLPCQTKLVDHESTKYRQASSATRTSSKHISTSSSKQRSRSRRSLSKSLHRLKHASSTSKERKYQRPSKSNESHNLPTSHSPKTHTSAKISHSNSRMKSNESVSSSRLSRRNNEDCLVDSDIIRTYTKSSSYSKNTSYSQRRNHSESYKRYDDNLLKPSSQYSRSHKRPRYR